jgi:hypothetical protein
MHAQKRPSAFTISPDNANYPPGHAPPIITPPMHFATAATRDMAPDPRTLYNVKSKSPNNMNALGEASHKLPAELPLPKAVPPKHDNVSQAPHNVSAKPSCSKPEPPKDGNAVPTHSLPSQKSTPTSAPTSASNKTGRVDVAPLPIAIEKLFVPGECNLSPLDEPHKNPGDTVQLLDHDALMQLQVFSISLAAKGKQTLSRAKDAYIKAEESYRMKRAVLISLVQTTRESELAHEKNVARLMDRYHHKMKGACKLTDTDAKSAAQILAIRTSEVAREESYLATEDRRRLEEFRNDLHEIDNARIISAITYADAVHGVVQASLGRQGVLAESTDTKERESLTNEVPRNETPVEQGCQTDNTPTAAHSKAKKSPRQPVFDHQTEVGHQSIDEVISHKEITAETDSLGKVDEHTALNDDKLSKALANANTGAVTPPEQQTAPSYQKAAVATSDTVRKVIELTMNGATLEGIDSAVEPSKQQARKAKLVGKKAKNEKRQGDDRGKISTNNDEPPVIPDSMTPVRDEVKEIKTKSKASEKKDISRVKVESELPTGEVLSDMHAATSALTKKDVLKAMSESNVPVKTTAAGNEYTMAKTELKAKTKDRTQAVEEPGNKEPNSSLSNLEAAKPGPRRKKPSQNKKTGKDGEVGGNGKAVGGGQTLTPQAGQAANEVRKGG